MGVPSSAASYAAGQDLAPAALRSAGLLEQLIAAGLQVHDDGPASPDMEPASACPAAWLPGCLDTVAELAS